MVSTRVCLLSALIIVFTVALASALSNTSEPRSQSSSAEGYRRHLFAGQHGHNTCDDVQHKVTTVAEAIALEMRRNYASKECGAKIVNANREAENTGSILNERRDEYLRSPCEAQGKFVIIELCEAVQPLRLELANFELFSSGPSTVRVSIARRFPSTNWTELMEVHMENGRQIQSFDIKKRQYAKYLKLELLSHHGREHFCTLSHVHLIGVSMADEFEAQELDLMPAQTVATMFSQGTFDDH